MVQILNFAFHLQYHKFIILAYSVSTQIVRIVQVLHGFFLKIG